MFAFSQLNQQFLVKLCSYTFSLFFHPNNLTLFFISFNCLVITSDLACLSTFTFIFYSLSVVTRKFNMGIIFSRTSGGSTVGWDGSKAGHLPAVEPHVGLNNRLHAGYFQACCPIVFPAAAADLLIDSWPYCTCAYCTLCTRRVNFWGCAQSTLQTDTGASLNAAGYLKESLVAPYKEKRKKQPWAH